MTPPGSPRARALREQHCVGPAALSVPHPDCALHGEETSDFRTQSVCTAGAPGSARGVAPAPLMRDAPGDRARLPVERHFDAQALKGGPAGVDEPGGGRHLDAVLAIVDALTISVVKFNVAPIRLYPGPS